MPTPARFCRSYLHFIEDGHARGSERIADPQRLDAYRLVLGWFSERDLGEERFTVILADRAQLADSEYVRWVCCDLLAKWRLKQLRGAYGGAWADGLIDPGSGAPWDVQPVACL